VIGGDGYHQYMRRSSTPTGVRLRTRHARVSEFLKVSTAAAMVATVTGCTQAVSVEVPLPDFGTSSTAASAARTCERLTAALPQTIGGASRIDAKPNSPLTAAWIRGTSIITFRCALPVRHARDESLLAVNNVDWRVVSGKHHTTFIAVDRALAVEVTIPREAGPAADYLVDIAPAIDTAAPRIA
jgi:hypothetical protein